MGNEKQDLMSNLRGATSEIHKGLEELVDAPNRFASLENYSDYLLQILRLFRGYEESLSTLLWNEIGFDFDSRRKVKCIEKDLHTLNISQLPQEAIPCTNPNSFASGFGYLYVLEGSTLGGRVILQSLKTYGIDSDSGASFFDCYGKNTGAMWSTFKEAASLHCHSQDRIDEACHAAIFAFEHYRSNIRPIAKL